jgi:hypothetical protein
LLLTGNILRHPEGFSFNILFSLKLGLEDWRLIRGDFRLCLRSLREKVLRIGLISGGEIGFILRFGTLDYIRAFGVWLD